MNIAIAIPALEADAPLDDLDVWDQVNAVSESLLRLGHATTIVRCSLDLLELRDELLNVQPDVVFNLVESLGGTDRLLPMLPMLVAALGIPITGSDATALAISGDKVAAKRWMQRAGLSTPGHCTSDEPEHARSVTSSDCGDCHAGWPRTMIQKPIFEHASYGLDDAVVRQFDSREQLLSSLRARRQNTGTPWFAEEFIDGREFNLSLLEFEDGPQVLPPAEIDFTELPPDKPRIVGYAAKWETTSPEYLLTPRRFDFPSADRGLLQDLSAIALECWRLFGLRGYGRVDFRVDTSGRAMVLEVNANPCLSTDAGFAAALEQAGIDYDHAISRILSNAVGSCQGVTSCS